MYEEIKETRRKTYWIIELIVICTVAGVGLLTIYLIDRESHKIQTEAEISRCMVKYMIKVDVMPYNRSLDEIDYWGKQLRWFKKPMGSNLWSFEIRSAGRDGKFHTEDDLYQSSTIENFSPKGKKQNE